MSHDRYFVNKVATRVAAFRDGRLDLYDGGYDDYFAALRGAADSGARVRRGPAATHRGPAVTHPAIEAAAPKPPGGRARRRAEAEDRNRKGRETRLFRERIAALEASILPLESRLKEIDVALGDSATYGEPGLARRLGEEKKTIEIDLAHLYDEWDEATSQLEQGGRPR